jgi:SpoIID/LytB domain protein
MWLGYSKRLRRRRARRRRLTTIVVAAALATATLPSLIVAAAGGEDVFTFEGGGYGHSVGMSQYGAYGMALDGYSWQEIVTHYYTGATVGNVDPDLAEQPIWVNLLQDQTRLELTVIATGSGPAQTAVFTLGAQSLEASLGQTVLIEHLGSNTCRATGPQGSIRGPCSIDIEWDGWAAWPSTALEVGGCSLPDWNSPGGTVWRPCRYARGTLHVRPDDTSQAFHLSVEIDIEDYVLGISESPYYWGSNGGMEALMAQAVAARSYALHRVVVRGEPSARPWCWCNLYDTTVDQFYVGWGHGRAEWLEAVAATEGKVLYHPADTWGGALIPIEAFYASSTFGWTEDCENGFTAYVPYIRAVDDHWSLLPEVGNPYGRWSASFTASELAARLPGLSTVTGAEVTACSETGAALEITFTGNGGPLAFTTRELRSRLGLRSMQVIAVGAPPSDVPACPGPATTGTAAVTLAGVLIDDDMAGDSRGDGDGVTECGELIEAYTVLRNEGLPLTALTATLQSNDPYVSIVWNSSSNYPNLARNATASNSSDWDLAVSASTPNGHVATLTLEVSAQGAGPWTIPVPLPVSCRVSSRAEGSMVVLNDVNGNGHAEAAVAYTRGGPIRLFVEDAAGLVSKTRVGSGRYELIDITTVPNFAGSAADEVAVLLVAEGVARVVVVDALTGEKLTTMRLPNASPFLDIEAVPSVGGTTAPELALLTQGTDGKARVILRDAASRALVGRVDIATAQAVDLEVIPGPTLAVLVRTGQRNRVVLRDAASHELVRKVNFGFTARLTAVDLEVMPDGDGLPLLAVVAEHRNGSVLVVTKRAANGSLVSRTRARGLTTATDMDLLAGTESSVVLGVLGDLSSGNSSIVLVDPTTRAVLHPSPFPAGADARELAMIPGLIGSLSSGTATRLRVTLRQAADGTSAGSFLIP